MRGSGVRVPLSAPFIYLTPLLYHMKYKFSRFFVSFFLSCFVGSTCVDAQSVDAGKFLNDNSSKKGFIKKSAVIVQ